MFWSHFMHCCLTKQSHFYKKRDFQLKFIDYCSGVGTMFSFEREKFWKGNPCIHVSRRMWCFLPPCSDITPTLFYGLNNTLGFSLPIVSLWHLFWWFSVFTGIGIIYLDFHWKLFQVYLMIALLLCLADMNKLSNFQSLIVINEGFYSLLFYDDKAIIDFRSFLKNFIFPFFISEY